ncbi:hypothetical protein [Eubacterium xylanophilum]|uniref:hypothetical protein n=1 Tax=Eubacterium xylanophilum TaxID=39497 RepID=UPI00047C2BFD|nr:hypothetical protein [Eubacterium xylanophilum]
MNFMDNLERKLGKFAIKNLMLYMCIINVVGSILGIINPTLYYSFLSLDVYQILHGQVWRLVTFVLYPSLNLSDGGFIINLLFYAIMLYIYFWIGRVLENMWGTFKFNAFYFFGIILIILFTFGYYFVLISANGANMGQFIGLSLSAQITLEEINLAMFLIFAFLFPDTQFMLYFLIPVKAKWLGYLYLGFNVYNIVTFFMSGQFQYIMNMFLIVAALIDFVVFYFLTRPTKRYTQKVKVKTKKRQSDRSKNSGGSGQGPRHKCAICGRTELDAPNLEFRYCSKCRGNYEYCSEHLFTHEHVK